MLKSRTYFRKLPDALPFSELNSLIARMSVLYEDLRIEMYGIAQESIPALDFMEDQYRRNYFLRRAIATLVEIAETVRFLNECKEFNILKEEFDRWAVNNWNRTIRVFSKYEPLLKSVRNDIGGHFGYKAARWAIENMNDSEIGKLEIIRSEQDYNKSGAKLIFAGEVAATALGRHKGVCNQIDFARYLIRVVRVCFKLAVRSVDSITAYYLLKRFAR